MDDRTTGAGGRPPLRSADRARTWLRRAFAAACLIAAVCGTAAGYASWSDGTRAAEALARERHAVTATTVGTTGYRSGDWPSDRTSTAASATWQYPPGRAHTGTVPVPPGTRKGDAVRVWVDDRGAVASAPPGTAELALEALLLGAAAATGVLVVSGALVRVGLRAVDARSARAWEAEWEDVEPLWSGRLRPGPGDG
ncbi:hypothetical protein SUDANB120_00194 [Streptomyces sp. enrichment culture]|uniref:Rv1733c family protein n=1 Tax=Streptomyces sp. enrichment culture TaxID=1795815 RepID=UPI003F557151